MGTAQPARGAAAGTGGSVVASLFQVFRSSRPSEVVIRGGTKSVSGDGRGVALAISPIYPWLMVMAGTGVVVIWLYAAQFPRATGLSVACVATMIALAAAVVGAILGFLFGIPRTLTGSVDAVASGTEAPLVRGQASPTRYIDNTNLEQLSDWLTKILVGVGLTQIPTLKAHALSLAAALKEPLGATGSASAFGMAVVLFFTVLGFLRAYLWTRLNLKSALKDADRLDQLEKAVEDLKVTDASIAAAVAYGLSIVSIDETRQDAGTNKLRDEAIGLLEQARRYAPESRQIAIVLGRLYRRRRQLSQGVKVLKETADIRQSNGFHDSDTAAIWYNLACYYNVQARAESDAEAGGHLRRSAGAALAECLRLHPADRDEAMKDDDLREMVTALAPVPRPDGRA